MLVDTELPFDGDLDPLLGIDSAPHVVVQVAAFRKRLKERILRRARSQLLIDFRGIPLIGEAAT